MASLEFILVRKDELITDQKEFLVTDMGNQLRVNSQHVVDSIIYENISPTQAIATINFR
jgi:hypothetical protein